LKGCNQDVLKTHSSSMLVGMATAATAIEQWQRACDRYAAGRLDGPQFRIELMRLLAESALSEPRCDALLRWLASITNDRPH
jgi:hypothetical protein